jgi:nucleotide-binding universal stress UspA family protein
MTLAWRLIVLGTHGRTGVAHVILGSVAERVVQRATCSVLTVPFGHHDA